MNFCGSNSGKYQNSLSAQSKDINMHKIDKSIIKVERIKRMFSTKEFSLGKNVNKTNFKFLVSISKNTKKLLISLLVRIEVGKHNLQEINFLIQV